MLSRRGLFRFAALAAPAIVLAPSLMRVSTMPARLVEREMVYVGNGTYQRYSGYEALHIDAADILTAAKYDWLQAAVCIEVARG